MVNPLVVFFSAAFAVCLIWLVSGFIAIVIDARREEARWKETEYYLKTNEKHRRAREAAEEAVLGAARSSTPERDDNRTESNA